MKSKKEQVIELLKEGRTVAEISKQLKMVYPNVWRIAKDYEWAEEIKRLKNNE